MNNVEKYIEFCKKESDIPLFSQPWWLDAVCGQDNWSVALVEKGGIILASMPYFMEKKYGLKFLKHPKLTPTLGIYLKYTANQQYDKKLSYEKEMSQQIINQLPKFDKFSYSFNSSIKNFLPFYWNGFKLNLKYTYVIEDLSNLDNVFNNFSSSAKKNIKKANKNGIKVVDSLDIKSFYNINKITFNQQNIKIPYSFEFLEKLFNTLVKNNSCIMKFAIGEENKIYSVMLGVYDNDKLYMLLGSSDRTIQTYGAEYLLYWEMMKFASMHHLKFDFEGSMIEGVERRNRSFGAVQESYINVEKVNSKIIQFKEMLK